MSIDRWSRIKDLVDLWTIPLNALEHRLQDYAQILSSDEISRTKRLRKPSDQTRFVIARGNLRFILSKYLDIPPNKIKFAYGICGKPHLAITHKSSLEFNLSHSEDYALCAITTGTPIGIDIEKVRATEPNYYVRLARRFFSIDELAMMHAAPDQEKILYFFCGWTRKEAYLKRHGHGLSQPLSSFTVSLSPHISNNVINHQSELETLSPAKTIDLTSPEGYCAAIAVAPESLVNLQYCDVDKLSNLTHSLFKSRSKSSS